MVDRPGRVWCSSAMPGLYFMTSNKRMWIVSIAVSVPWALAHTLWLDKYPWMIIIPIVLGLAIIVWLEWRRPL